MRKKWGKMEKVEIEKSIVNENAVVPMKKIKYINLNDFLSIMDTDECDSKYGITKSKRGQYKMGQTEVQIDIQRIIVSGQSFKLTTGLMSLLFLKSPLFYTNSDLLIYKKIIKLTKVHLTNRNQFRKDDNFKLNHIIYPLFANDDDDDDKRLKVGKSLQTNYMELHTDKKIDYKYWDDINELDFWLHRKQLDIMDIIMKSLQLLKN